MLPLCSSVVLSLCVAPRVLFFLPVARPFFLPSCRCVCFSLSYCSCLFVCVLVYFRDIVIPAVRVFLCLFCSFLVSSLHGLIRPRCLSSSFLYVALCFSLSFFLRQFRYVSCYSLYRSFFLLSRFIVFVMYVVVPSVCSSCIYCFACSSVPY